MFWVWPISVLSQIVFFRWERQTSGKRLCKYLTDPHMIRTMTPENMCHMTTTPPLPAHSHYPSMHRDMYLKPEPMISQYPIGPATSESGDMQQTQMLHQLLQHPHPQGQEWVTWHREIPPVGNYSWWIFLCHTAGSLFTRPRRGSTPTLPTAHWIPKSSQVSSNKNQVGRHLPLVLPHLHTSCSPWSYMMIMQCQTSSENIHAVNALYTFNSIYCVYCFTGLMQDADNSYLDPNYQCIKWQPHQQNKWTPLFDANCKELWVDLILTCSLTLSLFFREAKSSLWTLEIKRAIGV